MSIKYFKRFNSIDEKYIKSDMHIHSEWSDGKESVYSIAKRSRDLGLRQIAITDHIRSSSTYFGAYCREIKKVSKKLNVDILVGVETKIFDLQGNIDICKKAFKKADIRIASVHRFPVGERFIEANNFEKKICQQFELKLCLAAIKKGNFDILGHPGGMSLKYYREFPDKYFEEIVLTCKKRDIVFELNTFYHLPVLNRLLPLLKKHNVFISFGSDAHRLSNIGKPASIFDRINNG